MTDLETRNEVARVLKPIIDRQTETIVSTEKNTKYYNYLEQRVAAMEIVFEQGQGKNFIWDSLMSKLADEVILKSYINLLHHRELSEKRVFIILTRPLR